MCHPVQNTFRRSREYLEVNFNKSGTVKSRWGEGLRSKSSINCQLPEGGFLVSFQ